MPNQPVFYEFGGRVYPEYLKNWKALSWVQPFALWYCQGVGIDISMSEDLVGMDVGAGKTPLPGAIPIDKELGQDAMHLPCGEEELDYVCSSHCLEHLDDPVGALKHWRGKLKAGGVLFLYLPDPSMLYWQPMYNKKHKWSWYPSEVIRMIIEAGYEYVVHSERDLYWSFAVVGKKPCKVIQTT